MKGSVEVKNYHKSLYHGEDTYIDNDEPFWYIIEPLNYTWGKTFEIRKLKGGKYEVTGEMYTFWSNEHYQEYLKKERRELKNQEIHYYFYEKEQREIFPAKNLTEDHRVYVPPLF